MGVCLYWSINIYECWQVFAKCVALQMSAQNEAKQLVPNLNQKEINESAGSCVWLLFLLILSIRLSIRNMKKVFNSSTGRYNEWGQRLTVRCNFINLLSNRKLHLRTHGNWHWSFYFSRPLLVRIFCHFSGSIHWQLELIFLFQSS